MEAGIRDTRPFGAHRTIAIKTSPNSSGYHVVALRSSGKKVHRQVEDMINAVEAELLAGIPSDESAIFFRVMSVLEDRTGALASIPS